MSKNRRLTRLIDWQTLYPARVRFGCLGQGAAIVLIDLDSNRILDHFGEVGGRRILILSVNRAIPACQRILRNVAQAILAKNHRLSRLHPKDLKRLYLEHLSLERRFFEPDELPSGAAEQQIAYQGAILQHNRLYPFHTEGVFPGAVLRHGKLQQYQLEPHQYITLEPNDLLLLGHARDYDYLMKTRHLKNLYRAFHAPAFEDFSGRPGPKKLARQLLQPLLVFHLISKNKPDIFGQVRRVLVSLLPFLKG